MSELEDRRKAIEQSIQSCYSTWGDTYYEEYYGARAPYPPVHADLLRRLLLEERVHSVLDAGCGPASFLRRLGDDNLDLYGFDLTPEMVVEGKRVFAEMGLDPARIWEGSVLERAAYRSPVSDGGYDAAVCVGVMPHIAEEHDRVLFDNLYAAIRPGGLVAIEGRNQLFSLFTLNRPTFEFIRDELIRADDLLRSGGEVAARMQKALEAMRAHFRMDLPPIRRGKAGEPGYDEVLSRTHNPLSIRDEFAASGFRDVRVLFYHYHALPPMFADVLGEQFVSESLKLEQPDDWRGHFMASAFILVGRKP